MEQVTKTENNSQTHDQQPWWENENALDDYEARRAAARTFAGFCAVYLPHYLKMPAASFHMELLGHLGDHLRDFIEIIGFRGSAKSTFGSLALPLWAALEHPDRYPFIIPVADTGLQAAVNIANIKHELDHNLVIKQDYGEINGEFVEDWTLESEEEWQAKNMLLSNGVRILARSRGQKVRGLRHREHRPSLIIIDDPEDLEWVRTKTNRDKTEKWLRGEVIPAIEESGGRLIIIGNLLHTDALMARLKKDPTFLHLEYPLVDKQGKITWIAKYPNEQTLKRQEQKVGTVAFQREYLLKVVPEEGQEVTEEDIHYYDDEPKAGAIALHATSIDLAISQKETADYTAMVGGMLTFEEGRPKIYIKPYPINDRLDFKSTIEQGKAIHASIAGLHQFFIEDVAYQKAAIQEFERAMLPVMPFKPHGDKRSRLKVVASYIKNGTVLFPRHGCEDLIFQLIGFGIEEHDDLVDALTQLILGLVNQGLTKPEVVEIL